MPTYAYRCKNCDHSFDIVQSFSDDSLTTCPECAGTLRKVFGNIGVAFKGSGFYRNDSREGGSTQSSASNGSPAGESSDSVASKPAEKSAETSAEGKAPSAPAEKSKAPAASSASAASS